MSVLASVCFPFSDINLINFDYNLKDKLMGGSHGPHIAGNEKNMQESDEAMLGKIQRIELVKFNPNHFHLEALDPSTAVTLLGGAPTMVMGATGALLSYGYYAGQVRAYNQYLGVFRTGGRLAFGGVLGLALGYKFFGDR